MKGTQLTSTQLAVWEKLQNLEVGQRILGQDLMAATGITDRRLFFKTIEQLRDMRVHIGAKKVKDASGYYLMTMDEEIMDYYFRKDKELENQIVNNDGNAEHFFKEKYGESFNFTEYKATEELRRYGN
jgi:hypothetical protein